MQILQPTYVSNKRSKVDDTRYVDFLQLLRRPSLMSNGIHRFMDT